MCIGVLVISGESRTVCETVGDLAGAMRLEPSEVSPDPSHCCLCNAYLEKFKAHDATVEAWAWPEFVIELPKEK